MPNPTAPDPAVQAAIPAILRAVAQAMRDYDAIDGLPCTHDILYEVLWTVDAATATRGLGDGTWTELAAQVDAVALASEGGAL